MTNTCIECETCEACEGCRPLNDTPNGLLDSIDDYGFMDAGAAQCVKDAIRVTLKARGYLC